MNRLPHALLGSAAGLAYASVVGASPLLVGVAAFGAIFPDQDQRWAVHRAHAGAPCGIFEHRGPTHSVITALAVGLAVQWFSASHGLILTQFAVALTLGWLSHLAADAISPMGVPYLWPISARRFRVLPRGWRLESGSVWELPISASVFLLACAFSAPSAHAAPAKTPTPTDVPPTFTPQPTPQPPVIVVVTATPTDTPEPTATPEPCWKMTDGSIAFDQNGAPVPCDTPDPTETPTKVPTPTDPPTATPVPTQAPPQIVYVQKMSAPQIATVEVTREVTVEVTREITTTPSPTATPAPPTETPTTTQTDTPVATASATPQPTMLPIGAQGRDDWSTYPQPDPPPEPRVTLLQSWLIALTDSPAGQVVAAARDAGAQLLARYVSLSRPTDPGLPPAWMISLASLSGVGHERVVGSVARWSADPFPLPDGGPSDDQIRRFG